VQIYPKFGDENLSEKFSSRNGVFVKSIPVVEAVVAGRTVGSGAAFG
jgi:hypothetical protein